MQYVLFSCEIDWKKGKNVTVKTIKKKQKHKGRGTTRTVTKTVQNDSFFNFFNPPQGKGRAALLLQLSESVVFEDLNGITCHHCLKI